MDRQRVFVKVVGFSDVERHALNTVFRLSEDRDPAYAPWLEGAVGAPSQPDVLLVDGSSAEAVLSQVREMPVGQRLIWVGKQAPAHAWREMLRPIQWAELLMDLDGVFAARQADSGYLDLDFSTPAPLDGATSLAPMRALLVGPEGLDQQTLRSSLAVQGVDVVDVAPGTDEALALISRHRYALAVLDMDAPMVDAWALAKLLTAERRGIRVLGMSEHAGPLAPWWRRRRLQRHVVQSPMSGLLARPIDVIQLREFLAAGAITA